ncbi:MAG TPA: cupredoxin domain-containing protein [Candidatus Dormibacteraeota bacterium]|nr:cupredoxin domain-containing protein [Candidatus Dormibacteraeota bacterium]
MTRIITTFIAAMALLSLGAGVLPAAAGSTVTNIVASNWKFTPSKITMDVGNPTTLHLSSTEGVHGLVSPELGLKLTTIAPGKPVTVTVTPKKVGTYVLHCAIFCGLGHADMKLTVVVTK